MKKHRIILFGTTGGMILLLLILVLIILYSGTNSKLISILALIGSFLILTYLLFFIFIVYRPLLNLKDKLHFLARGEIKELNRKKSPSEMCMLENDLELHLKNLNKLISVLNNLAEGNYSEETDTFSPDNEIGKALTKLRESIKEASAETGKRRTEDELQNWASKGYAYFGELLRSYESNLEALATGFIKELSNYLEMEVGGMYLAMEHNEELVYQLYGAWAFDREKSLKESYLPGEGLVGRCALEKEQIFITDVPENYIRIRSGLGEDLPSSLILEPVMIDNEVIAIIELAGFEEVPAYKRDFLKTLSNSISAGLARVLGGM